jgi:Arc/MetJ family transcription regulator
MGICMKTTVEISDALLQEAKRTAARGRTTVRALIEEGLRQVLRERLRRQQIFTLRRATFKGDGLQPDVAQGSWERLRDLAYEGRGA